MPEPTGNGTPGGVTGNPWTSTLAGIVDCREMFRGRSRNADLTGVPTYQRIFLVRTNVQNPNLRNVAAAPGIAWREQHPDDVNAYLVESTTQQDGESPFHYKVTYNYKYLDETETIPWLRPATFSFNGSLASAPAFWHYPTDSNSATQIIVNSAGDPLSGLDRDEAEFSVSIQFNQRPPFNYAKAQLYVGAINSDTWSGGVARTWKCQSITSTRKSEVVPAANPDSPPVRVYYWETSTTLAYRRDTWDLKTWDVGFNEIVSGKRVKIYAGSEPVSEPAALQSGSAKAPGQPPNMLQFRIYPTMTFVGTFPPLPDTPLTTYPYSILPAYWAT
jgi:hypothetical protein